MNRTINVVLLVLSAVVIIFMSFQQPGRYLFAYLSAIAGFVISLYLLLRSRSRKN